MDRSARVLVAGGGFSGLAAATLLGHYGVPCLIIERRTQLPPTSRNERLSVPAVELLRILDLEEPVRAAGFHPDELGDMLQADTLAGPELGRVPQPWVAVPPRLSPLEPVCCNHAWLRELLRERALELGAEIWTGSELTDLRKEEADGLVADVRRPEGETSVRVSYVIGADGPHSLVRERALIEAEGPGTIAQLHGVAFRADLGEAIRGRHFVGVQLDGVGGTLLKESGPDSWALLRPRPADDSPGEGEDLVALARAAAGLPDLKVEIDGTFSLPITLLTAERFTRGRVALIGDAACSLPPTPGMHGGNVLQDAQNLAWKLALILSGTAGPRLLDSYDAERRPLAGLTLTDALARISVTPPSEDLPDRLTLEFGAVYRSSAVVSEGDQTFVDPLESAGLPGTRVPYLGADLFGRDFVCLAGPGWASADVPLTALKPSWAVTLGVSASGAVLVRPDGVIAWRARTASPEHDLEAVLSHILNRGDQP
ncbi:FAD-dependent monooxygenase [Nonomuraea guangzhouensis]|uniref:FAD-dependent monooxygenase n=1 Tax=Nonomuraea guangzhouensis TaxID=1291555 RepID=A0ABW4GBR2_9ACTN|nr:FAD-dependent monooxygenase [Nonomuraea guangzhouensis]